MASGDTIFVFTPLNNEPPSSNYATFDTRNGHPTLDFDATTEEKAVFTGVLPRNYSGGGITNTIHWTGGTATGGTVVWETSIERVNTDIDSDSFATGNKGTTVTNATSGIPNSTAIAHSNGAAMDSLAAGEPFRIAITREVADSEDSMGGDAEILAVEIKET